jgi:GDPmannose 4,6-dehydratase
MNALICGVTGQDGAYLAQFLLGKGYQVWGTSRDAQISQFTNLEYLGIKDQVHKISMAPNDFRSVLSAIERSQPDEIYYLSGQSSVGLSFEQPVESLESIAIGTLNLLEAVRFLKKSIKIYNASSSECFGDNNSVACDEETPFRPCSPYAVAKASAHWMVRNYRESYGIFAANGILFNHESPLRPGRFVTKKIINGAIRISRGSQEKLFLGRLDISRDWGWAPEYVQAMWKMLQQDVPGDYVIATGRINSLQEFVSTAFEVLGLDWKSFVVSSDEFIRPTDLKATIGNPEKASQILNWRAQKLMPDIIFAMIKAASPISK